MGKNRKAAGIRSEWLIRRRIIDLGIFLFLLAGCGMCMLFVFDLGVVVAVVGCWIGSLRPVLLFHFPLCPGMGQVGWMNGWMDGLFFMFR